MEIYEITGFATGVSQAGVNFLQPVDSYQNLENGFIYRQVLQSRKGVDFFAPRLADESRVLLIIEFIHPDATKELLAFDENFLYTFNTATLSFDQIPFAGSMAAYPGFANTSNDFYISGTAYPTATNGVRFVFTGEGITPNAAGSSIFFYNGTDVRDFTSVADNPNYSPPISGALTKAIYVIWFGERLNFLSPTIGGVDFTQGVLYSGIRNSAGNGDKFNVAGSGLLQEDTSENITGVSILGNVLAINFERSNRTLEKTRDVFNPYFIRKVPSVLGTNAKFSAVSWSDEVKSVGKTGVISTDGRKSGRVDNKIPYFTADEIDQSDFNLTYGGFDRINNQFLWAYKSDEADTTTQDKVLVNNYEEDTWAVYDERFSVFGQTDKGAELTWDDIDETGGNESWAQWDTTEELWDKIGLTAAVQKTLAGDDLGFIYNLNQDYDDYFTNISAITQADPAVLTVSPSAFQAGDRIVIKDVEGMTEINSDEPYTVTAATPISITINQDSTLFTAYTTGGNLSKTIQFKAETIPFNPYRSQGRRCFVSHIEFLVDTNGGFLEVDILADEEMTPIKSNVLVQPTNELKAREWITVTVDDEANFFTFVMKQESVSAQVRITSLRIHAQPGGFTSG